MRILILPLVTLLLAACNGGHALTIPPAATRVDSARVVSDLRYLASPELEGRAVGSPGNAAAREYVHRALVEANVQPLPGGWFQDFPVGSVTGVNVLGVVEGTAFPHRFIIVTAHYDHLGVRDGQIFHGADDNASGTAALLEIARQIAASPPRHSVIFAALDAEEGGLRGARALVADPPVPLDSIRMNVNLDMVSRNDRDELYVAGPYHYPFLADHVAEVAARAEISLRIGHDDPRLGSDDWTYQSDHAAFHEVGIPFAYFGVEDHPDYHRPTDTFENTDPRFFVRAVETVLDFIRQVDRSDLTR